MPEFFCSPKFTEYVHKVVDIHALTVQGKGESQEADTIRDSADGPWRELSEEEREEIGRISEFLYGERRLLMRYHIEIKEWLDAHTITPQIKCGEVHLIAPDGMDRTGQFEETFSAELGRITVVNDQITICGSDYYLGDPLVIWTGTGWDYSA